MDRLLQAGPERSESLVTFPGYP